MGEFLDFRETGEQLGVEPMNLARVRREFFDHITTLPDVLQANVFALDRTIVWSTIPELIGRRLLGGEELEEVLSKWVRDLLLCSSQLNDEHEAVDVIGTLSEVLSGFEAQMAKAAIQLEWAPKPAPMVVSQPVLLK